jgi:type II secretory pathway pseudopilin PulG
MKTSRKSSDTNKEKQRQEVVSASGNAGFTLLELVLATLISSLVIGILSVSLTFAVRTWERNQNRKQSFMPNMIELLKLQLAQFNPAHNPSEGDSNPVFKGEEHFLTITTNHSVKAISQGVPVIARYAYSASERKLYYAEIPFNPYDTEALEEFLDIEPKEDINAWPRFYTAEVAGFSLSYLDEESAELTNSWDDDETVPKAVVVRWAPDDETPPTASVIYPNFLFSQSEDDEEPLFERNTAPISGRRGGRSR